MGDDMQTITEQAAKDARDVFESYGSKAREAIDYMEQLIYASLRKSEPIEDVRAGALKEAADIARYYAETDYCAMGYPEDGGIAASGTAHMIQQDILALILEAKT